MADSKENTAGPKGWFPGMEAMETGVKMNADLKISEDDLKQGQHVSSHMAAALLGMNKFVKLEGAMDQIRREGKFSTGELDDLDNYHKLIVDGIGKEASLIFSFDLTRKVNEPDFHELIAQYYKALGEKLGLENSNQVQKMMVKRAAIRCHLRG